jgi:hypothetical protein
MKYGSGIGHSQRPRPWKQVPGTRLDTCVGSMVSHSVHRLRYYVGAGAVVEFPGAHGAPECHVRAVSPSPR